MTATVMFAIGSAMSATLLAVAVAVMVRTFGPRRAELPVRRFVPPPKPMSAEEILGSLRSQLAANRERHGIVVDRGDTVVIRWAPGFQGWSLIVNGLTSNHLDLEELFRVAAVRIGALRKAA